MEDGRRRGEMALYVLPRAVRTLLPDNWIRNGSRKMQFAERFVSFLIISSISLQITYRMAFILSFSALMTTAIHRPEALRGLSRWALAFVTSSPNVKLWKPRHGDEIGLSKTGSTTFIRDPDLEPSHYHTTSDLSE
jgi:hypothetical protein